MILRLLRALLFLAGCAVVAYGVSLWSVPAGVITAGLLTCAVAVLAERDATDHELVDEIRRRITTERSAE